MTPNRSASIIREHRERAGLSRAALAKKLRISYSYLSNIEAGLDRPSPAIVVKMLVALKLTEDRSERVERLRCLAVRLPPEQVDRIVIDAHEAGGDFEDIQFALFTAQKEWMQTYGTPDAAPSRRGSTSQNDLRHVA